MEYLKYRFKVNHLNKLPVGGFEVHAEVRFWVL